MNAIQKNLFVIGVLLMTVFAFIQPLRYQSPIYIPMTESVSALKQAPMQTIPMGSDQRKNMVATCITGAATILGLYVLNEEHPVLV